MIGMGVDEEILRCEICNGLLLNSLELQVPESTFELTDKMMGITLWECENCGVVQLKDVPLSDNYDIAQHSIGVSKEFRNAKKDTLGFFIDDYNLEGKDIAEVGCGDGQYLEILKEIGVEPKGFQRREELVGRFDCIFSFYYLEHLPDPYSFLMKIYSCLNENGLLYLEVPNYDYMVKKGVWVEFTRDHRFYYGNKSITYLLSMIGYTVEDIFQENNICMTVIARKQHNTLPKLKDKISVNINAFKEMVKELGEFNVWGAGHYSQLLLKTTGVKPKRIFDSNPKKVGKINGVEVEFCGEVGTRSNNLKDVINEPIVVICGSYNDEVIKMLKSFGCKNIIDWRY